MAGDFKDKEATGPGSGAAILWVQSRRGDSEGAPAATRMCSWTGVLADVPGSWRTAWP